MPESQEPSASLAVPADGPDEMNTNIPLEIPSSSIDGEKPKKKRRKRSRKVCSLSYGCDALRWPSEGGL